MPLPTARRTAFHPPNTSEVIVSAASITRKNTGRLTFQEPRLPTRSAYVVETRANGSLYRQITVESVNVGGGRRGANGQCRAYERPDRKHDQLVDDQARTNPETGTVCGYQV